MNDIDELESVWKDVLLIKLGHCFSSLLQETEENRKVRTSGVPVTISRTQLYRADVAHTVRGNFAIVSGLMLCTIMRG